MKSMKIKSVILSFDYELFFGDCSGTVQKTLIEPTNAILDAMDSVRFKGNFFVDWQMLKYLKQENDTRCQEDYALIVAQLKDIVRRGHRIELHIHPHWVDAKYNGDGTWDFSNFSHYSLQSFSQDHIVEMFIEGYDLLISIAREVCPDYKIVAFRAGGWAVQPFCALKEAFLKTGICVDSSTMPGVEIETDYSYCNFLNIGIPSKGFYRFSDNVDVNDKNGMFLEVPISSVKSNIVSRIAGKIARIMGADFKTLADGTHFRIANNPDRWNVPSKRGVCTFSTIPPLEGLFRILLSHENVFCFIDHPKDFSKQTVPGIKFMATCCKSILYKDFLNN